MSELKTLKTMTFNKSSGLINRAWFLQVRITLRYEHWIFWVGRRFVAGLFGVSLFVLFIANIIYYYMESGLGLVELFKWFIETNKIPLFLNPIMILFYTFIVFLLLFISKKPPCNSP